MAILPRQFVRLMEMLRAELMALRESSQEQVRAIRSETERERSGDEKEEQWRIATIRAGENEAKEASAYRKKNHTIQVLLLVVTFMAFLAAAIYAAIAARQLHTMKRALVETQKQTFIQREAAKNSERAWVGLESIPVVDAVQANPLLLAGHFSVKNFGAGPAIKTDVFSIPETWDGKTKPEPGHDYMAAGRSICNIPIGVVTGTENGMKRGFSPGPMGYILFPGGVHAEQVGGGPWTGDPVPPIAHIWFVGCVAYLDQFNTLHWTRFCVESSYLAKPPLTKDAPLQYCALFNDTDDNKEKD